MFRPNRQQLEGAPRRCTLRRVREEIRRSLYDGCYAARVRILTLSFILC